MSGVAVPRHAGMGITRYIDDLDFVRGISLLVWFETDRRDVTNYALVLVARVGERIETVRVYDAAHGSNEMHRYTKELGKRPPSDVHGGTLGEDMRAAIDAIKDGYEEMVEGWRRG
jgi:hypothetical protein